MNEEFHCTLIQFKNGHTKLDELLVRSLTWTRSIAENGPKFGKEMLEKPVDFSKNVVWSDESKFNLFSSGGRVMFWRTPGEEFDSKRTIPKIKHDGGLRLFHPSGS